MAETVSSPLGVPAQTAETDQHSHGRQMRIIHKADGGRVQSHGPLGLRCSRCDTVDFTPDMLERARPSVGRRKAGNVIKHTTGKGQQGIDHYRNHSSLGFGKRSGK